MENIYKQVLENYKTLINSCFDSSLKDICHSVVHYLVKFEKPTV